MEVACLELVGFEMFGLASFVWSDLGICTSNFGAPWSSGGRRFGWCAEWAGCGLEGR